MKQPTEKQIARFLECFDTLSKFEAMIQLVRGQTAFSAADWPDKPDPAVVEVKKWLAELARVEPAYL